MHRSGWNAAPKFAVCVVGVLAATSNGIGSPHRTLVALTGDEAQRSNGEVVQMRFIAGPSVGPGGDILFGATRLGGTDDGTIQEGDTITITASAVGKRNGFTSINSSNQQAVGIEGQVYNPGALVSYQPSPISNAFTGPKGAFTSSGEFVTWQFTSIPGPGSIVPRPSGAGIYRALGGDTLSPVATSIDIIIEDQYRGTSRPWFPTMTEGGRVLYQQAISVPNPGNPSDVRLDNAIWSNDGGESQVILRTGDLAPGVNAPIAISPGVRFNRAGSMVFRANLSRTADVTRDNDTGIWTGTVESMAPLVREGDSVPGINGAIFRLFDLPKIGSASEVSFNARVSSSSGGVSLSTDSGLWVTRDGVPELVAREGDVAPGTAGSLFDSFVAVGDSDRIPNHAVGALSDVVFRGALRSADAGDILQPDADTGLWARFDGTLSLVAREGFAAPGAGSAVFDDFGDEFEILSNNRSEFVFMASLQAGVGGVEDGVNDDGLWVFGGEDEELALIVREGEIIDVSSEQDGSDMRTVRFIRFDMVSGLADNGHLAYSVSFTDGTDASFATIIPGPSAFAMLLIGTPLCARRRR